MTLSVAPEEPDEGPPAPTPPDGLGAAGSALWHSIADEYDLRPDELRALEDAAREADLIAKLQAELDRAESLVVRGSMGQSVAHPMVGELRAHRSTLGTLLKSLNLAAAGGGEDDARTASEAGRRAARARWDRNRGA